MNVVATFFPKAQLGLAMGILDVASYIAGVVRAPLASLIFATSDGWHGLARFAGVCALLFYFYNIFSVSRGEGEGDGGGCLRRCRSGHGGSCI